MKHLYFVRHGLSVMNQQGIFSGITDTPLADEGRDQAVAAGKSLQGVQIDCIVASPIARAFDTATIIAEQIGYDRANILTNDYFIERDFGPLEGTQYSPNARLDEVDGVEHSRDLIERVNKGYAYLQTLPADTILVVSHGAVGRALDHLLSDQIPFHQTRRFGNAEVVQLV